MSCHKGPRQKQLQVASVSLRRDLRQGESTMDVVVPGYCNFSPISNKRKEVGGRSLMDEVNHGNLTVSSSVLFLCSINFYW